MKELPGISEEKTFFFIFQNVYIGNLYTTLCNLLENELNHTILSDVKTFYTYVYLVYIYIMRVSYDPFEMDILILIYLHMY